MNHSLKSLLNLSGRTFLVSGGAGLLGSQISHGLAEQGANVLVASRDAENCRSFAKGLAESYGTDCRGYGVDIGDSEAVEALRIAVTDDFETLDGLVNCSGFGKKNTWESISEEDWLFDINISLNGVFRMTKAFEPHLKSPGGVILNVASMYGLVAPDHRMYDGERYANPPSYNAAKGGVVQLNRYLASFLSPKGIRVNAISPGPFPYESTQKENPAFIERLGEKTMVGRIGHPHEVKAAAVMLCTDAASYITGQNISIDGGWTAW
ncbi:SDR family oxidoreductase [uncultured Algimonas sp.]|uniref:SDR family NAD(P)-dependent oxidoreductase n=1 Tax=uncultured Algimonas sp. TaxID=1547920 RepID=UPI002603EB8F|nr:SDR family oxidoreductase [uncultured Algimonas sp.]